MKKILLFCLLLSSLTLYSKEFYEDLSPTQRQKLAESYRATGERFLELGQKTRGNQYLKLADRIAKFDNKNASNLPKIEAEKPVEVLPSPTLEEFPILEDLFFEEDAFSFLNEPYPAQPIEHSPSLKSYPKNLKDWPALPTDSEGAMKALLERYLVGLVTENSPLVLSILAPNLALPGYEEVLDKKSQETFYLELFSLFQFDNLTPDDLYNLNSQSVSLFNETQGMIILQAREKAPTALADWHYWEDFWQTSHHFFFEKINGEWKIIAFDIDLDTAMLPTGF